MNIQGFDWDAGNREKCKNHGVSLEDVESVFVHEPLVSANIQHQS